MSPHARALVLAEFDTRRRRRRWRQRRKISGLVTTTNIGENDASVREQQKVYRRAVQLDATPPLFSRRNARAEFYFPIFAGRKIWSTFSITLAVGRPPAHAYNAPLPVFILRFLLAKMRLQNFFAVDAYLQKTDQKTLAKRRLQPAILTIAVCSRERETSAKTTTTTTIVNMRSSSRARAKQKNFWRPSLLMHFDARRSRNFGTCEPFWAARARARACARVPTR